MVTADELVPILQEILKTQKALKDEIVGLRKNNQRIDGDTRKALLLSMTPKEREALQEEEILSSELIEKCVDFIIADGKKRLRY